ncbi:hypothetical protein HanIR_Chr05g0241661 [Helianthus annuus]|nr:hypothetical protein HanIR_Chr05g0241661 [Helianthus annuus]
MRKRGDSSLRGVPLTPLEKLYPTGCTDEITLWHLDLRISLMTINCQLLTVLKMLKKS